MCSSGIFSDSSSQPLFRDRGRSITGPSFRPCAAFIPFCLFLATANLNAADFPVASANLSVLQPSTPGGSATSGPNADPKQSDRNCRGTVRDYQLPPNTDIRPLEKDLADHWDSLRHSPSFPPPVRLILASDEDEEVEREEEPKEADDNTNDQKREETEAPKSPPEPDISKPGADFGDYPNSAYTLPKGRSYLEVTPLSYAGKDRNNPASFSFNYLLRYGITDDVEFRLTGAGLTSVLHPESTVAGFAPLILDTKIHLWDDQIEKLIPAASFEAFIQTNWASPEFQSGYQPSVNINLDFPFTEKTNLEMTFGYSGVQDAVDVVTGERYLPRFGHKIPKLGSEGLNVNLFSFQWAVEQQVTEKFQLFLQGYYNGEVYRQSAAGRVVGIGYFYQFDKRATFFNSYNGGIDPSTPNFSTQIGFAFAF